MDTALDDPLLGLRFEGRYRVERRLAGGGMASVYLAVDTRLDRVVALKVMHPALAADEQFVARFIREARAAARLSHPNVVAVHDQGSDPVGGVFLVMEHVAGRTLRDLLDERGRLGPREAVDVLEPVLAGLGAAHAVGLVHCDVKPENVLLGDDGRVKVVDFGLVRAASAATAQHRPAGLLLGTAAYLAPEQVERGVADARADVYAAGLLLFEMLTGAPAYAGDNPTQVAYRHLREDVPAPSRLVPGSPPALDAVVARATARDPGGRPGDAHRLLAEVVAARRTLPAPDPRQGAPAPRSDGQPGGAPTVVVPRRPHDTRALPAPDPGRPGGTARRRRHALVAGLLAILLLAGAGGGAVWWRTAGPGAYVDTPRLLSLSQEDAEAKAEQLGLTVRYDDARFDERLPEDEVLSSEPAPGEPLRRGGTITLVLSKGKERYAVPDVRTTTLEEARAELARANLAVGDVLHRYSDDVAKGKVLESTPQGGTMLRRGAAVTLVVSRGEAPVPVPDLVGRQGGEAAEQLRRLGLLVSLREEFSDQWPAGTVAAQGPRGGELPRGGTVELVVSRGPAPVVVPDVVDLPVDEALRVLEEAGLRPHTSGPSLFNQVLGTTPGAGESVPRGSDVTVSTL